MSPGDALGLLRRSSFPRVSGDEPERIDDYSYTLEFSPRERG